MARPVKPIGPRQVLRGKIEVHDADTLYVHTEGKKLGYRLWGIDALELGQRCRLGNEEVKCGAQSRKALLELVANKEVACEKLDEDVRKDKEGKTVRRDVSLCYVGQVEINAELVRQGWALDYGKFTKGYYAPLQQQAEARKIGIWQYDAFRKPSEYRQARYKEMARKAREAKAANP